MRKISYEDIKTGLKLKGLTGKVGIVDGVYHSGWCTSYRTKKEKDCTRDRQCGVSISWEDGSESFPYSSDLLNLEMSE